MQKAWFYKEYGSIDVLEFGEFPVPKPGPGQILVKVKAAALNPVDFKKREGLFKSDDCDFPPALNMHFHHSGFFTWERLIGSWNNVTPVWLEAADLHLPAHLCPLWESARSSLSVLPIHRGEHKDVLTWKLHRAPLPVKARDIYAALTQLSAPPTYPIYPPSLWKTICPTKMILLSWLIFWNRNLTWEVLQRKGWYGPGRCAFCREAEETNLHMFFQCQWTQQIWLDLSLNFDLPFTAFSNVQEGMKWWSSQTVKRRSAFLTVCWHIWDWRNATIFSNTRRPALNLQQKAKDSMIVMGILDPPSM